MKAIWKGVISFGLVSIPVKLYNAVEPKQFSFHMLCGKCKTPLKYQRFCPKCKAEVAWQNVLYGFAIEKGKWHIFTREQLAKLKPAKAEQIEIISFTNFDNFDPIYFASNYYVIPQGDAKAYSLLRDVLRAITKVALVKIILHNKEHIALIRPYLGGLLLTTLHYTYEIRDITVFRELKEKVTFKKEEFELAKKLVLSLVKEPELEKYKDSFEEKLKQVILGKVEKVKKPSPKKLLEALQLSIKKEGKEERKEEKEK